MLVLLIARYVSNLINEHYYYYYYYYYYVRQTPVELLSTSDDSSGGVQDPLQLVSRSSRRVREQCVAEIYTTGNERVN